VRWEAGADDDPGLLNAARVLHLEASLRRGQRRVREAIALLDRALVLDRWGESPTLLMGRSKALEEVGQHEEAVALLLGLDSQLDAGSELRSRFVVRGQLVSNPCHLGRHAEAAALLTELRLLACSLGNQLDLLRVEWLRGRVAAGLGPRRERPFPDLIPWSERRAGDVRLHGRSARSGRATGRRTRGSHRRDSGRSRSAAGLCRGA
jgi:tetratricopeptide (TPR) repeat protein